MSELIKTVKVLETVEREWQIEFGRTAGERVICHMRGVYYAHTFDGEWRYSAAFQLPEPVRIEAEAMFWQNKTLGADEYRDEDGDLWQFRNATFSSVESRSFCMGDYWQPWETESLCDMAKDGGAINSFALKWHRANYRPEPDEAWGPDGLPVKMADDQVRDADGNAVRMWIVEFSGGRAEVAIEILGSIVHWSWFPGRPVKLDHPCTDPSQLARVEAFWERNKPKDQGCSSCGGSGNIVVSSGGEIIGTSIRSCPKCQAKPFTAAMVDGCPNSSPIHEVAFPKKFTVHLGSREEVELVYGSGAFEGVNEIDIVFETEEKRDEFKKTLAETRLRREEPSGYSDPNLPADVLLRTDGTRVRMVRAEIDADLFVYIESGASFTPELATILSCPPWLPGTAERAAAWGREYLARQKVPEKTKVVWEGECKGWTSDVPIMPGDVYLRFRMREEDARNLVGKRVRIEVVE